MSETFGQEAVLRDILGRNEETIRAFDIKSEIAMLCFVLSVEAGHSFISFADLRTTRPLLALVLFVTFIAALVAYMSVLFPAQIPSSGYPRVKAHSATWHGTHILSRIPEARPLMTSFAPSPAPTMRITSHTRSSSCKPFAMPSVGGSSARCASL